MAKTAVVQARINPELKRNVEALLSKLGLTTTEAITLFFGNYIPDGPSFRKNKKLDEIAPIYK